MTTDTVSRLANALTEPQREHLTKLKAHIKRKDEVRAQVGLPPDDIVEVLVTRDVPPSGAEYIRTIFGYGYMINCVERNGKWETVAHVKRKKVDKIFKDLGIS